MRKLLGIAFGVSTQLLFLATLLPFFRFLRNDFAAAPEGPLWIDAVLALSFGIPHSILLYPPTRKLVTRWLPSELYGCLFCVATCASLWLEFGLWRGSRSVLWAWPESLRPTVEAVHLGCWGLLFYTLYLSGIEYQTGLAPWWHWVRGRAVTRREFRPKGAFQYVRHPVYLSVLGLVWLTPILTADRVLLIAVWTAYIFVGSYLKDRRLARLLGEQYTQYMDKVPAYPLLTWRLPEPQGAVMR
jgi:protein-S-isoprenylcysteine O-methyltransferase Ste14